jgi:hypothetical protein
MAEFDDLHASIPMTSRRAPEMKSYWLFSIWILSKTKANRLMPGAPSLKMSSSSASLFQATKTNVIDRPIRPSDKARFPKQYAAFREGKEEDAQLVGTPLKDWPMVGRAQCAELHYFGIRTVEQVSDVRDDICLKIPGLTALKQTAGVWLQKAKSTAEAAKIAKRLDDAETQVADMRKQQSDLIAMNQALQDQLREFLTQRTAQAA